MPAPSESSWNYAPMLWHVNVSNYKPFIAPIKLIKNYAARYGMIHDMPAVYRHDLMCDLLFIASCPLGYDAA